jgi:2-dehydropantoate 2-reductase
LRVAVLGAGAIGGFIAAVLARARNSVALVARGDHLAAIRREGLRIISEVGDFAIEVPAAADLRELGAFEAVLVTVKAHQLSGVLSQLKPAVDSGATIVPLQNGIPFWYFADRTLESVDPGGVIRAAIPRDQTVGAVIHTSGEIVRPGTIRQSGGRNFILGSPDCVPSERVERMSALLASAGMDAPAVPDIRPAVWQKLLGNVALNPVSALTRLTIKPMLDDPATHSLIARLMEETLCVAAAAGVPLEVSVEERITFAARLADVKTSMLQDLEAGRPLELEPIVGAVIEIAEMFEVAVPTVRTVYALTRSLPRASVA